MYTACYTLMASGTQLEGALNPSSLGASLSEVGIRAGLASPALSEAGAALGLWPRTFRRRGRAPCPPSRYSHMVGKDPHTPPF